MFVLVAGYAYTQAPDPLYEFVGADGSRIEILTSTLGRYYKGNSVRYFEFTEDGVYLRVTWFDAGKSVWMASSDKDKLVAIYPAGNTWSRKKTSLDEASAATIAVFDKATAEVVRATEALKSAKDTTSVAAAIDIASSAIGAMVKDAKVISEKYKNARGSETKAFELIRPAQERFLKAQTDFKAALQAIDATILADERVQAAFKKMGEIKD